MRIQASHFARGLLPLTVAAIVSVLINYGGTFVLIIQAAKAADLSSLQIASWVWSMSVGLGVVGLWLSYRYREPIITAWSTPGAAVLITSLPFVSYGEAIGAYLVSATAFVLLGFSGWFERIVRLIPAGIAAGLLAGILLNFGISAFANVEVDPVFGLILIAVYVLLRRVAPLYSIIGVLVAGLLIVFYDNRLDLDSVEFQLAGPMFVMPEFSLNAILSISVPLFLVTLTGQYMTGMLVLRNDGYTTSANPILISTGFGSMLASVFGSHAFNVAAISAAICTGSNAHPDPSKRYIAGVICGALYIVVGVFGYGFVSLLLSLPSTFVATLAGLALLGTIGTTLTAAMEEPTGRETALITFVATAANISLLGIGGAFWGLIIGVSCHVILHTKFGFRKNIEATGQDTKNA